MIRGPVVGRFGIELYGSLGPGDIVQEKAEITKIHRFEFLSENIVMCIFTLGSKFTYNCSIDKNKFRAGVFTVYFMVFNGESYKAAQTIFRIN